MKNVQELKRKLNLEIERCGDLTNDKIINISQKLDIYIVEEQRKRLNNLK